VAIGDLDRDGDSDLVTANKFNSDVSVLLGNGDGTFQSPTSIAVGGQPQFVAIGDLNRDAAADLVIASYGSNAVCVLLGHGDGTLMRRILRREPFPVRSRSEISTATLCSTSWRRMAVMMT